MAALVDASSPIRFSVKTASNTNADSASFTAPANSLLVLCISHDGSTGTHGTLTTTISLTTGTALTWTKQVERALAETTDGAASIIYTAPAVASEARVVRVNSTWTLSTGVTLQRSIKLYVVTGVDLGGTPVDTVGANNEGGSATNNLTTTSITPGANGLLVACDCDWSALGVFQTSADLTQDTATFADISVCSGYKAVTSGVGATANLDAAGAGAAQHKWCQIVVREAAGGGATPSGMLLRGVASLLPFPILWPFAAAFALRTRKHWNPRKR